jgi:hypothetical protein
VILRPALAIAGKYILPKSPSSVPFRVVRRGEYYLAFHVPDAYSRLDSIRRLSSFKTHLKKHGWDSKTSTGSSQRGNSLTTDEGIQEEQVPMLNGNQEIQLSGLPESWNSEISDLNSFLLDRKSIYLVHPLTY